MLLNYGDRLPLCHSERSEKSRPSAPKYHLSFIHSVPRESSNILVKDEILHCVQNDKRGIGLRGSTVYIRHVILHCVQNDRGGLWVLFSDFISIESHLVVSGRCVEGHTTLPRSALCYKSSLALNFSHDNTYVPHHENHINNSPLAALCLDRFYR